MTQSLLVGIATEDNQIVSLDLATQISNLNDTMLFLVSAILDKMPRVDLNDRATVRLEAIDANLTLGTVSAVSSIGNLQNIGSIAANLIPGHISNIGAFHLYNNIVVS